MMLLRVVNSHAWPPAFVTGLFQNCYRNIGASRNMERRHLAVFTLMGNGHLYPLLPLCAEMTRRGYRVTCPTNERFARTVHGADLEAVMFADTPIDEALQIENARRLRAPVDDFSRLETTPLEWAYLRKSNNDLLTQIDAFYAANVPDVILYNRYSIAGRIIAHRLQRPAIQLSPHFAYPGRYRFWDRGVPTNPAEIIAYAARLDALLSDHDIDGVDHLWHLESLNIHFLPEQFQYSNVSFDERFLFAGNRLEHRFHPVWRKPSGNQPIVLISGYSGLPQTHTPDLEYFRTFIDALANCACHCVLSIGNELPAQSLGPLPANFEINRRASHLEILPHAAVFACHAGMGSSLEALYNGVPVLAVPATPYTHEVAYRIAELGVGTLLPRNELSLEAVRTSIARMLADRELMQRTRDLQQLFGRSAGATTAADSIELFLEQI
jgi:MGT family glycosyltransferase